MIDRLAGFAIGTTFLGIMWLTFLGFWQAALAAMLIGGLIFKIGERHDPPNQRDVRHGDRYDPR